MISQNRWGQLLVIAVLCLLGIGTLMLISTSMTKTAAGYLSTTKQVLLIGIGGLLCWFFAAVDYRRWQRWAAPIFIGATLALILCFVPGIGRTHNGASRWIGPKAFGFQPSEVAKLAVLIGLAAWYSRQGIHSIKFARGTFYPSLILIVPVLLIAGEVDLGAASLVGCSSAALMFAGGLNFAFAVVGGGSALLALYLAIQAIPQRKLRWDVFWDIMKNPLDHLRDEGMQQVRGMMAFANGGWEGVGLGQGIQKMQGLAYSHTDFIFPMVGEELGLRWSLAVIACFVAILWTGMVISLKAPDRFGRLLAFGLTVLLACQALINIGVTTACLPNKGMPLPFVSYGGSNLWSCLMAIGLLLNIHKHGAAATTVPLGSPSRKRVTPRI